MALLCTATTLRPLAEAMEERILHSADVSPLLIGSDIQDHQTIAAGTAGTQPSEIAFIDATLSGADDLRADLLAQQAAGRPIEVVTIERGSDGLALIGSTLAERHGITAIHLLTEGTTGAIELGAATLDSATLLQRAGEIASWSSALTADADLLVYGCFTGAGDAGRALLASLAQLTGADVAASDDATGSAARGGNWLLEQRAGAITAAAALSVSAQQAWAGLLGSEFQANTTTNNTQSTAAATRGSQQAVAVDAAGNFVVVWTSTGQDQGGTDGVYARRFAADGSPLTGEILVNATTAADQHHARVVSDDAGNFIVTWTSDGQDGSQDGVYARRFNSAGMALGSEIAVNTTTFGAQGNSTIAINRANGNFVVAWEGNGTGDGAGVFFRRFAADGSAIDASEQRANTSDTGNESNPAVAMDSSGRVVVAFDVDNHMYFQRFSAAGVAQGGATQVDNALSNSTGAAIAMDANGNFTLVYRETNTLTGVWGRGYNADGSQRYGWFQAATGDAASPSIAMAGNGAFIVTYEKTGGAGLEIYARKYNATGNPQGAAFIVNQYVNGDQDKASIALRDQDNFVVVWSGGSAVSTGGVLVRTFESAAPVITSNGGGAAAAVSVAESTTAVTTVTATDADLPAQTLIYSIAGGADAALFTINGSSGALAFVAAPDHEQPGDAGANNIYDVTVQASDGTWTDTQAISVTVADVLDGPTSAPDSYAVTEDQAFTASVASGWFDPAWGVRQRIGFDNAAGPALAEAVVLVTLSPANIDYSRLQGSGQDLRFVDNDGAVLDHEIESWTPGGVSRVWVRVPQIDAASSADGVWMYYGNGAAADTQNASAVSGNARLVLHMGSTLADASASGNTITQSATTVVSGQIGNARLFDGTTSAVNAGSAAAIDNLFAGGGSVSAWINPGGWGEGGYGRIASKASSTFGGGATGDGWNFQVGGAAQNLIFEYGFGSTVGRWATPVGSISLGAWQHVAVVYDSSSTAQTPVIYIDGVAQTLTVMSTPTGVSSSDAALPLRIGNQALSTDRTFDGAIDDVRAHDSVRTAAQIAAEYRAATGALVTMGAAQAASPGVLNNDNANGGPALTAQLVAGPTNAASFTLRPDGTFDYTPAGDFAGIDTFSYRAASGPALGAVTTVQLNVAGVNDVPVISSNGGGANAAVAVAENGTAVATVVAADVDGTTPTYSISGGADAARFTINATTGVLAFAAAPNFEAPNDAGGNNVYDVIVTASDGTLTDTQSIAVTVTDVNEAPVISSNGGGATATISVAENGTAVTTAAASDVDGTTPTYSISGGADAARFTINATTGVLAFVAAPNFETPTDAGGNNVYDVIVTASDGTLTDTQAIAVTVTNVNEAPVLSAPVSALSATEDVAFTFAVPSGTFSDPDTADALAYGASQSSGAALPAWLAFDATTRTFSGTAGNADVGNVSVRITATDGAGASALGDFMLTVANVNDAPTLAMPIASTTATEASAFTFSVPPATFSDADPGDGLAYSARLASGAALPSWLAFDAATLSFAGTPQGSDTGSFEIRVTATDSSGASVQAAFTVEVAFATTAPLAPESEPEITLQAKTPPPPGAPATADGNVASSTAAARTPPAAEPPAVAPGASGQVATGAAATRTAIMVVGTGLNDSAEASPSATIGINPGAALSASLTGAFEVTPSTRLFARTDTVVFDVEPAQLSDTAVSLSSHLQRDETFMRKLEELQRRMNDSGEIQRTVAESGVVLSAGVSIGYVIWLVRGGVLISSMLSALPAWQMIDPLPVLTAARRDKARASNEPDDRDVERLFDDAKDAPAPRGPLQQRRPVAEGAL